MTAAALFACAGPESAERAGASSAEGERLTQRLVTLGDALAKQAAVVVALHTPLPGRVAAVGQLAADIPPVSLEVDIVRRGFNTCFNSGSVAAAGAQATCAGAAVDALRQWANDVGPPVKPMVDTKLAELAYLKAALTALLEQTEALVQRAAEARLETEGIVRDGFGAMERTEENPLESFRTKASARDNMKRLIAAREQLDETTAHIENHIRPLADSARTLNGQVLAAVAVFGDAGSAPAPSTAPAPPTATP